MIQGSHKCISSNRESSIGTSSFQKFRRCAAPKTTPGGGGFAPAPVPPPSPANLGPSAPFLRFRALSGPFLRFFGTPPPPGGGGVNTSSSSHLRNWIPYALGTPHQSHSGKHEESTGTKASIFKKNDRGWRCWESIIMSHFFRRASVP